MSSPDKAQPEWLNALYMEGYLKEILQEPELQVERVEIRSGSGEGDGFMCQILRVIMDLNSPEKGRFTLPLIAKLEPSTSLADSMAESNLFDVEVFYYTKLHSKCLSFILGLPNPTIYAPTFYFVDSEKRILFLQDLRDSGFVMQDRCEFLSLEQTELAIDCFGALHGASLRALEQDPGLKEGLPRCMWGGTLALPFTLLIANGMKVIEMHADKFGLSQNYREEISKIAREVEGGRLNVCNVQEDEINVMVHGDANKANLMYHFTDGVADSAKLYDFQCVHYNGIAQDLHYFLYLNSKSEVIVNHLDHLLERYYHKFKEVAPESTDVTLERVKKNFAARNYFGFVLATIFRPFVASKVPYDMEKILNNEEIVENGFTEEVYLHDLKNFLPFFEMNGVF